MNQHEPLALKALKLPYAISKWLLTVYSAIFFTPYQVALSVLSGFLFSERFESGDANYYIYMWPIRGLLSIFLLGLWLAAVCSPFALMYLLDKYIFHTHWSHAESLWMTAIGTLVLGSVLGIMNLKDPKRKQQTRQAMKLCGYFFMDILSTILTILTILLFFNAKKVFVGHFDGPERRYFNFISYLFLLSLVDWLIFGFKLLTIVYPVRKYELQILLAKYEHEEFKQKMVTLQEGLYTLRELAYLPFQIAFFFCMKPLLSVKFLDCMNYLSHLGFKERLIMLTQANLLIFAILLAILLNGPFQNLTVRMFKELSQLEKKQKSSQDEVKKFQSIDDSKAIIEQIYTPVFSRIVGALCKFIMLVTLCPSTIRLIQIQLSERKNNPVPAQGNWLVYAVKVIFLELNPDVSALDIFNDYGNRMGRDFGANLLLILSIVLNPISFIQIVTSLVKWDAPLTPENLDKKNDLIFSAYPMIIFDIPLICAFIIVNVLALYQLPKNIPLFKCLLFGNDSSEFVFNGFLIKRRKLFFGNLFGCMIAQINLLITDFLTLTIFPFLFLLPSHLRLIYKARSERWFDDALRRSLITKNYWKYLALGYYSLRVKFLRDPRYLKFVSECDQKLETDFPLKEDMDEIENYAYRIRKGYYKQKYQYYKKILHARFFTNMAKGTKSLFGLIGAGNFYKDSEEKWNKVLEASSIEGNFEEALKLETEYYNQTKGDSKTMFIKMLFKLVSLLLLWRLPTFLQLMENGPFQNPDPEFKKDVYLALRLYKFSMKLLLADILYGWVHSLLLLFSSTDRSYVMHKWKVLIQETPLHTEEIIESQFADYFKFKKEYAGFVLDDLLCYLIIGFSRVLLYRTDLFKRIQLLVTLPQLENMNARNVNTLLLTIVFQDLLTTTFVLPMLLVSPCRLYSFFLYVKEGYFYQDINVNVKYDKFASIAMIKSQVREARSKVITKVLEGFKTDCIVFGGLLLCMLNPARLSFVMYLRRKLKSKYNMKKQRQGRDYYDDEFAKDLIEEVKNIVRETKEDLMSLIAIFIILFGVYEVKETWERVGKLAKYKWRHSELYRWLNKPKKDLQVTKQERNVFLGKLNWMCVTDLGQFLSMQDKLTICLLNKKTRHFYMSTPHLWIHYFREVVNPMANLVDETVDVAIESINHYRKELAERNNKELDFKLGIRFVLKEEAIRSVISLPQLVSAPYHGLFKVRELLTKREFVVGEVRELLRQYHEDAMNEHNNYANLEMARGTITYRFRFRHNPQALTTDLVPDDFKTRMKGFEVLEYGFYKVVFFVIDKFIRVFSIFVQDYDYSPQTIWSFFVNLFYSLLQPLVCLVMLAAVWYLFKFYYYFLEMDFVHSMVGPLGVHVLTAIVLFQLQLHPYYANRRFNPLGFLIILKNGVVGASTLILKPLYEKLTEIFRFILFRLVNNIKEVFNVALSFIRMGFGAVYWIYTFPIIIATQALVGRGTIPEVLHLGLVLVWILWPGYMGFHHGGSRNIFIGILVCLAQIGVAIQVIRKYSRR